MKPINRLNDHRQFQNFSSKNVKTKKINRHVNQYKDEGVLLPITREEKVLTSKVRLHPEYVAFTFGLDGCASQLLNYLIYYELSPTDNSVKTDKATLMRFQRFCSLFGRSHKEGTIKSSIKKLVQGNILLSQQRHTYWLNPLIATEGSDEQRRTLVRNYSQGLINKGKDAFDAFYPPYHKRQSPPGTKLPHH